MLQKETFGKEEKDSLEDAVRTRWSKYFKRMTVKEDKSPRLFQLAGKWVYMNVLG